MCIVSYRNVPDTAQIVIITDSLPPDITPVFRLVRVSRTVVFFVVFGVLLFFIVYFPF